MIPRSQIHTISLPVLTTYLALIFSPVWVIFIMKPDQLTRVPIYLFFSYQHEIFTPTVTPSMEVSIILSHHCLPVDSLLSILPYQPIHGLSALLCLTMSLRIGIWILYRRYLYQRSRRLI